ncbi:DUF6160 family protein [Acinetobacter tjernbergiae]|uniref:DUF6160 domain-containing protein n=1 Tax=Acinetobacter tjernbergiae DSM 14971 = CIP 107465 TaxID=1120928 RepID=V2W4Y6_9GAMM|nr:DUF6160 family protein [Acinetobacter tjernbergiae]ESK55074.1 hypothetical protein F990_02242 [Acinetobacter tjernbergiae DSM 14971 = CIP 107465]MBH2030052.1 hypothetical protein [Moraxellaceae bacterium]
MKKTILFLLFATSFSHAELQVLDNQALQAVEGQAGADLSLKLSLNHNVMSNADLQDATKSPTFNCTNLEYCRLAISFNKRFVQQNTGDAADLWTKAASDPSSTAKGRKLWLVMKGIQGTTNIQKLGLDGVDLVYKNDSGVDKIKPAIQLSFDVSKPIQIRNFGFNALSIEQDKVLSYYDASGNLIEESSTTPSDYGYLKTSTYAAKTQTMGTVASGATTANNYDTGRETGFMGVQMNGNLALQGRVMMFGCDGSHPRC